MTNYQIIPMTKQYTQSYAKALDAVARERIYIGLLEMPSMEWVERFVDNALEMNWIYFIAVSQGEVIGWCNIAKLNREIYAHAGLLGIGVIASERGKGVGEALIRAALDEAKMRGLERVALQVRTGNEAAISLYEKVGFVREGLHKKAICLDGVYEDEYSMACFVEVER